MPRKRQPVSLSEEEDRPELELNLEREMSESVVKKERKQFQATPDVIAQIEKYHKIKDKKK